MVAIARCPWFPITFMGVLVNVCLCAPVLPSFICRFCPNRNTDLTCRRTIQSWCHIGIYSGNCMHMGGIMYSKPAVGRYMWNKSIVSFWKKRNILRHCRVRWRLDHAKLCVIQEMGRSIFIESLKCWTQEYVTPRRWPWHQQHFLGKHRLQEVQRLLPSQISFEDLDEDGWWKGPHHGPNKRTHALYQ